MTRISAVLEGPSAPWGENNDMVTYEVQADDGTSGVIFRKTSSPPLTGGEEIQPNGKTKQGKNKFKVGAVYHGQGGGGGSYDGDKQRSKEQCMRGEAIQAAANFLSAKGDAAKLLAASEVIYKYIEGLDLPTNDATSPTPESVTTPPAQTDEIPF